jgi:hypothetical protein
MATQWSPGQPWPGSQTSQPSGGGGWTPGQPWQDPAQQQQKQDSGWSLNPLDDWSKLNSGIGDWINQHTGIGSFNPGIGSAVSTVGGIIPGLVNLGVAAATPWNETSQNRIVQAGEGFAHGLTDTAADLATAGGTIPGWTGMVKDTLGNLPLNYTPNTLKDYSTQKGGPGLLGAGLNDAANLALGAGTVGKVAELGEIGEAARAAMSADKVAQLAKAAEGGLPGDVAAAGSEARLAAAADAASKANFAPENVLQRAKMLDRLDVFRQGVDTAFNPLRAWQSLGAPLGRAAVLDAVPEAGLDTQTARMAEGAQEATQGVSEHATEPVAPVAPVELSPLQRAVQEAVAAEEAKTAAAPGPRPAAPGEVTLYRGQPYNPNVPVGTDNWTTHLPEAQSHAAASGGQVFTVNVPEAVAAEAHNAAQAAGDFGTHNVVHHLPAQYADLAQPLEQGNVMTKPAPAPAPAAAEPDLRPRNLGPKEKQVNLARAKEIPDWATKVVSHLPEFAKKALRAMEYRSQGHQLAGVIQESERTMRMKQAAELREPYVKAHIAAVQDLAKQAGLELEHADRIVGERVHAAMTAGPAWHAMEDLKPQLDAIESGAVEKAFGFHGKLPDEFNTPEFRDRVQQIADLTAQHIEGRGEFAATSPYLGARGMEGVDSTEATMTASQKAMLKEALAARQQAADLQPKIAEEYWQTHGQIAEHRAAAEAASQEMGAARADKASATNEIVENRYGPRIQEQPTGEITPGEQANANLTNKQAVSSGTGRPEETPQETYRRALKAEQALNDYNAATARERVAYQAMLDAHKSVADLQDQLSNATLPSQMAAGALHGRSDTLLEKLSAQMDNAPVNRVPPVYQPITRAALEIARMAKDHPELADVLADAPKSFAEAVKYSADKGFDPVHFSEMTEEKARRLVMGSSVLSPDLGKTEVGLFRKGRTGQLANAGLDSRTLAGLAAQWASVWREDRVNAIADHVDRLYAVPAPKNELGMRYNPNPAELTWWDARRRGLLSTVKPETGESTAVQGQYLIPKSVARTLDAYSKDHSNMLQRALAKTTNPWRTLVLTASPKFYVNHMVGHIMLGAIQGVSLSQWAGAWKEARNGFEHYPELTKSGIYEREAGMPASLIPQSSIGQARASEGMMGAVRGVQSKLNNAVNTVDAFAKAALALRGEAKGLTREDALHFAQQAGVDYSALSPFERQVVRSVIPFYSFEKGVLKIVMQYPLDHPVAANMLMQLGRLQQHWAVDSHGNPLPSNYQSVVDIPGVGKVNLRNLTPFKDVGSLVTPEGITNSLQFVVQAGVRTGLGVASPGVKAGVKTGPTGLAEPDVPFGAQLMNSLSTTPQGQLLSGGNPATFLGVPKVDQATLDKAGARNVLTQAETQLPLATQQQATAFPVDTRTLQGGLTSAAAAGTPVTAPVTPGQTAATGTQATAEQIQAALTAAQDKQAASAAASRAAKGPSVRKGRSGKVRVSKPRKASNKPRKASSGRSSSSHSTGARAAHMPKVRTVKAPTVRFKLRQGFGKASNSSGSVFHNAERGVAGVRKRRKR